MELTVRVMGEARYGANSRVKLNATNQQNVNPIGELLASLPFPTYFCAPKTENRFPIFFQKALGRPSTNVLQLGGRLRLLNPTHWTTDLLATKVSCQKNCWACFYQKTGADCKQEVRRLLGPAADVGRLASPTSGNSRQTTSLSLPDGRDGRRRGSVFSETPVARRRFRHNEKIFSGGTSPDQIGVVSSFWRDSWQLVRSRVSVT
jgi:hypothetical protein